MCERMPAFLFSSSHLIYSCLSSHPLEFHISSRKLIFCLSLLSMPPHLSRSIPFQITEASKTVHAYEINLFVNRLYILTFVDDKKCHISRHFSSVYRVFIVFSLIFVISLVFSLNRMNVFGLIDIFFSFLYTDSQISIKKERSGFAPLFETVQNAIKFW